MKRGGKRPGAGRPKGSKNKTKKEETKVLRVPLSLLDKIKDFINNWKKGNEIKIKTKKATKKTHRAF